MNKIENSSRIISGATVSENESLIKEFPELDKISHKFTPKETLGKRGLVFKDKATLLALCAVQYAIEDSGLDFSNEEIKNTTGVVVSSNLGNVDTICETIEIINREDSNSLSALNTPRASSNVITSNIAIKYQLRGPNITLCNGSSSGTDAIRISNNLLNTNRAKRVIVVGVEAVNQFVQSLWNGSFRDDDSYCELVECAACVILESVENKPSLIEGDLPIVATVQTGILENIESHLGDLEVSPPVQWFVPNTSLDGINKIRKVKNILNDRKINMVFHDLCQVVGDSYGAQGVLQCVIGTEILKHNQESIIIASSGGNRGDYLSTLTLRKE